MPVQQSKTRLDVESSAGGSYGPLASAVLAENGEVVSLLLRHGANVDAVEDEGWTGM